MAQNAASSFATTMHIAIVTEIETCLVPQVAALANAIERHAAGGRSHPGRCVQRDAVRLHRDARGRRAGRRGTATGRPADQARLPPDRSAVLRCRLASSASPPPLASRLRKSARCTATRLIEPPASTSTIFQPEAVCFIT
jgi:hypothetical protein